MTPTVLLVALLVAGLLYGFFIARPKEKQIINKVYVLTGQDLKAVVRYGMTVVAVAMLTGLSLDRIFSLDSYWTVFGIGLVSLSAEVFYRKVAVPFLARREVSKT